MISILLYWKALQEHHHDHHAFFFFFFHCSLNARREMSHLCLYVVNTQAYICYYLYVHYYIYIYYYLFICPYLTAHLSRGTSRTVRTAFPCPSLHCITSGCVGAGECSWVGWEGRKAGVTYTPAVLLLFLIVQHTQPVLQQSNLVSGNWVNENMSWVGVKNLYLPSTVVISTEVSSTIGVVVHAESKSPWTDLVQFRIHKENKLLNKCKWDT